MDSSIVFIGGGNMATSLVSGLRSADCPGERITIVEPDADKRRQLADDHGVRTVAEADAEVLGADAVILAVKPQLLPAVCADLATRLADRRPLIISIAAGVPLAALAQWLGEDFAFVRCMPNTPSLIGAGATGLYAGTGVTADQRELADAILATAGITVWVDAESRLDAVTATSGSGPAYFFAFMEAMHAGARELGLDDDTARELVLHTALGAARMAIESGDDPATLREKVTSKGGTTAAALERFEAGDLNALVRDAMQAAARRADTLGQELMDDTRR